MCAKKGAAACLHRARVVTLVLGLSAFAVLIINSRGRATAQLPKDWSYGPSLIVTPNREFAASSYVHEQLRPNAVRDAHSDAWVAELEHQISRYYGVVSVNIDQYSAPLYVVASDQPPVRVRAERVSDPEWTFEPPPQQWQSVPLPDGFQPSAGTDKEAIVYQPSTGRYWEFWAMERSGRKVVDSAGRRVDEWRAAWGGEIDDLARNPGYFPTTSEGYKFGTTATGLASLTSLITITEQRQGAINHAIHVALLQTRWSVWAHPAQRTDGEESDPNEIPQGATFRLPESVNLGQIDMDPYARMVASAVQKYGMVVRDTVGAGFCTLKKPLSKRADHPYFGVGCILRCAKGRVEADTIPTATIAFAAFPGTNWWRFRRPSKVTRSSRNTGT